MNNHAEDFRELTIINNDMQGYGFTDLSNVQSGATRLLNSGSELLNNYINTIEIKAYNNGYQDAMTSLQGIDIKSTIIGGIIAASIIALPTLISKIHNSYTTHKTKEQNSANQHTGYRN